MELVEIRWNCGGLEYRQRKVFKIDGGHYILQTSDEWGPWRKVEGVKGDASDAERWPG